jgi:hypothetical protein
MRIWKVFAPCAAAGVLVGSLFAFQRPFREYPAIEYNTFPLPADAHEKTEWVFARLMYPPAPTARFGYRGRGWEWSQGMSSWTQDYPRADRHFSAALRRLTRIHVRSAEQPVNLDDGDDVYNWPFLYAVQTGEWDLSDAQAARMREFLLRGGFFMCDDFWGEFEWQVFEKSMKKVFPDRPIVELQNEDAVFHTVFDLDDRYQVPSERSAASGRTWKCNPCEAHWRGIYDDQGRLLAAMAFNSDVGDSWEWADAPYYPEKFAALGIRIGVNYVMYSLTH